MHRSGTSLLGNWVSSLGLHLGEKFYKPSVYNPKGYFEDIDFLNLHKNMLPYYGIDRGGHEVIHKFKITNTHRNEIIKLLNKKNKKEQWGWKDPRTVLFLETYKELISDGLYIVVFRTWENVVKSLIKREIGETRKKPKTIIDLILYPITELRNYKKLVNHYAEIWIFYNEAILNNFDYQDKNVIFTNYKSLLKNDKLIFLKIKKMGFKIKYKPFEEVFDKDILSETNNFFFKFYLSHNFKKRIRRINVEFETRIKNEFGHMFTK